MKFAKNKIAVFTLIVILSVLGVAKIVFPHTAHAANTSAPSVNIQYGDSTNVSPNLPGECASQLSGEGTSTTDGHDPDCLRVKILDATGTNYTDDFRVCLNYNGIAACTAWASDIGLTESQSAMTKGGNNGNLSGTMSISVQTRPLSSTSLPTGTTFGNVQIGVALAYQNHNDACRSSSGMNFASEGGAWSGWSYGAQQDNDPGCFQVGLKVGSVNAPPGAQYVSSTIPTTANVSLAYNGNYNIVVKNTGSPWPVVGQSGSIVRDVDGHCDEGNFTYAADGSNTCSDYRIYSSQRFRLERTDSTPIVVRSKQLRPNSGDIYYDSGHYAFTQPDTTITSQTDVSNVSTANTIPFYIKQQITYHRETGSYEICVPGNPTSGGDGGVDPIGVIQAMNYNFLQNPIAWILNKIGLLNTANAMYTDPGGTGETCDTFPYDYIAETPDSWTMDVNAGENANFAPINITTPATAGSYTLRFKMVDLQNLNSNSNGYTDGKFGTEGTVAIQVSSGAPTLSGTLVPTPATCEIQANESTCPIDFAWSVDNPETVPTAITAIGMDDINVSNSLTPDHQSGTKKIYVPHGDTTYYLYNHTFSLVESKDFPDGHGVQVSTTCAPNTTWTGTKCNSDSSLQPPTNFKTSCDQTSAGNPATGKLSWDLPSGYTLTFIRVQDNTTNPPAMVVLVPENGDYTGTHSEAAPYTFGAVFNHSYTAWIHTRASGGQYSTPVYSSFSCRSIQPSQSGVCSTPPDHTPGHQCISGVPSAVTSTPSSWTWTCGSLVDGGPSATCSELKKKTKVKEL